MKLHENECRNYIRHFAYYAVFTVLLILINTIFTDKRFPWVLLIVFVWSIVILMHAAVLIILTIRSQDHPGNQDHPGKRENDVKSGEEGAPGAGGTEKSENSENAINSRGAGCEN